MKIYVSDKDTKYYIEYGVDGYEAIVVTEREPIEILSLEQHDKELLREFAEKLKYTIRLNNSDEETGELAYVVDINCLFEDINELLEEPVCKENIINELLKERGV